MRNAIVGAAALAVAALPFNAEAQSKKTIPPLPSNIPLIKMDGEVPIIPRAGHELITVAVLGGSEKTPDAFRVSYELAANQHLTEGVLAKTPTFTIYAPELAPPKFQNAVPEVCAGFLGVKFEYAKTGKYTATINLRDWQSVIGSFRRYGCIVINNQALMP